MSTTNGTEIKIGPSTGCTTCAFTGLCKYEEEYNEYIRRAKELLSYLDDPPNECSECVVHPIGLEIDCNRRVI